MTTDHTPSNPTAPAAPAAPAVPTGPKAPVTFSPAAAAAPGRTAPTFLAGLAGLAGASPPAVLPGSPAGARKPKRKRVSIDEAAKVYRAINFKAVTDEHVWSTADGGWASIPRALAMVATVVIKEAHKSKFKSSSAAGVTYMTLWLRSQASGMAWIDSEADAALESGYGGERGVTTFRRHLRSLKDLGFIDYFEESRGRVKWVLLNHPYRVVKRLFEEGQIKQATFSAVQERAQAVGGVEEFESGKEGAE